MTVWAVMLVRDEADIIEHTVRHLLAEVDHVLVADNESVDGTRRILDGLWIDNQDRLTIVDDHDPAYWQSKKTTALARQALEGGAHWVVPVDADEVWYSTDGRRVADYLNGLAPDVAIVEAEMHHHLPSALDPPASCPRCGTSGLVPGVRIESRDLVVEHARVLPDSLPLAPGEVDDIPCPECEGRVEPNPLRRIGFRKREHGGLPKVACRARHDLTIHAGNHSASYDGTALAVKGLSIRHFSWRSAEQYLRKIRNGEQAYALTDLPADVGVHWRQYAGKPDSAILEWFQRWGYAARPYEDTSLLWDPAPVRGPDGIYPAHPAP